MSKKTPHEDEAIVDSIDDKKGPAPNPFDPDSLRATADINTVGAEKILMRVPVRKPNKQEFIRVHAGPDYRLPCDILEFEREIYVVIPEMVPVLMEDVRRVEFRLCVTRQGAVFFWPVPMPSSDGRINSWNESSREAANLAENSWIRMISNSGENAYSVYRATGEIPDPKWPEKTMTELLELALKDGKRIDSADHPIVQQLRGA